MTRRFWIASMLCFGVFVASAGVAASETDLDGPVEDDQAAATATEYAPSVAAPQPVSVDGGPPAPYATEPWEPEETLAAKNLLVAIPSDGTAALTGVVLDSTTGDAVPGASVSLESTSISGLGGTTTTDSDGAFAFVNIWPEECIDDLCAAGVELDSTSSGSRIAYKFTVFKSGYGTYTVMNDTFDESTGYQTTVELSSEVQTFDESAPKRRKHARDDWYD